MGEVEAAFAMSVRDECLRLDFKQKLHPQAQGYVLMKRKMTDVTTSTSDIPIINFQQQESPVKICPRNKKREMFIQFYPAVTCGSGHLLGGKELLTW